MGFLKCCAYSSSRVVFKSNMNRCFSRPFLLIAITAAPNFCVDAFVLIPKSRVATVLRSAKPNSLDTFSELNILPICDKPGGDKLSTPQPALSITNHFRKISTAGIVWTATAQIAMADSPDWGIFEGRTGSLLHPITMGSLFVFSLYTAYLGFQWRRQRTLGDEIGTLRKTLPNLDGAPSVLAALAAAKDANDLYKINSLNAALATEEKIAALTAERKALAEAGLRDKHFQQGAMLAFIGTCFAIEGPLNTYARAGKLFPGPHLYAGAGLVCLWALAAACVPAMQKGNDSARLVHIGANVAGIGMFAWQVVSGLPILFKVIEKTSWP